MAKAVGLIGSLTGKVGNTVFASVKGETIARVYNPNVANPDTVRQRFSRAKMALAGIIARELIRFIRLGWNHVAPGREFQRAVGIMIPVDNQIITGDPANDPKPEMNFSNLQLALSKNDLGHIATGNPDFSTAGSVTFTATAPEGMFKDNGGNTVGLGYVAVAFCEDMEGVFMKTGVMTAAGQAEEIKIDGIPAGYSGLNFSVYCFVKQIPEAINGVPSDRLPWMFPAPTSACSYVGRGDLA